MTKSISLLILSAFLIFSFEGCSNSASLGDLMGEYNNNFAMPNTQSNREYAEPGDENFDPTRMLLENYFVIDTGTFIVAGPEKCASYNWRIARTSALGTPLNLHYLRDHSPYSRDFAVYIPTSGLEVGSYQLTLTIETQEGEKFTDSCRLVIYEE